MTYAYVVLRDLVRIALNIAALNGINILSYDVQNAYSTSECREKIWTRDSPEFGSESGTIMIFRMALYVLKYSSTAFLVH